MSPVADDKGREEAPEAPAPPSVDEGWLEEKIKSILDRLLGDDDEKGDDKTPEKPQEPRNDREREETLRDRVRAAVAELEQERSHQKEHEELKSKVAQPPQPETKPWRHRIWD